MSIWRLISHNSIFEVHTSWTTPILAYLHAPKNCMSSCIRLQEIACICNFYTHATCWWWVSLNLCGPQECCQGDENIFIFVCIKMGCPPSNLIGIQKNRIWTTVTAHHICNNEYHIFRSKTGFGQFLDPANSDIFFNCCAVTMVRMRCFWIHTSGSFKQLEFSLFLRFEIFQLAKHPAKNSYSIYI